MESKPLFFKEKHSFGLGGALSLFELLSKSSKRTSLFIVLFS